MSRFRNTSIVFAEHSRSKREWRTNRGAITPRIIGLIVAPDRNVVNVNVRDERAFLTVLPLPTVTAKPRRHLDAGARLGHITS